MARIGLMDNGYEPIAVGTHTFLIYDASYDETFGKIVINLVTADGKTHKENYSILKANNTVNEGALSAFSYLARVALNDSDRDDVDVNELIGRYFTAEVTHDKQPSNNDPTKIMTWVRLGSKKSANGFTEQPSNKTIEIINKAKQAREQAPVVAEEPTQTVEATTDTGFDLNDILGLGG